MKKIIAILMTIALTLSFAACGKTEDKPEREEQTTKNSVVESAIATTSKEEVESTTEKAEDKETATKEEKPTETITEATVENYFYNPENNIIEENNLSIRPYRVYWDNGYLVAECFVINGYDYAITQINVEELNFSNHSGLIASGNFGIIENVTLQPNEHVIWTFKFAPDCVYMPNADLSYLSCSYSCSYNY